MFKFIIALYILIFSNLIYAQSEQNQKKLDEIFSHDILKLNFPDGLPIDSMASITKKSGYKIYFDDNIDTDLAIPQNNSQISSYDLFKSYLDKFNLSYEIQHDFLIRIFKDHNHQNKIPYSYSSFIFISSERYSCYERVHDLIAKYDMKNKMQDFTDPSIENKGLKVIPINASHKDLRINFTCINKDKTSEFLSMTVTGTKYDEIILMSAQLELDLEKMIKKD